MGMDVPVGGPSSSLGVNVTIGLAGLFGFRLLTRGEVGGLRWPLPGVGRTLAGREFDETRALHAACILPHSSSNGNHIPSIPA